MMKTVKQLALISALVASAIMIGGCNTIHGVGEDIQAGGHAISSAAEGD